MPKIKKVRFKIDGELAEYDMYYNSEKGFHLKDFPEKVYRLGDTGWDAYKRYNFKTEAELSTGYDEIIDAYHKKSRIAEKVILIYVDCTQPASQDYDEYRVKRKPGIPEWFGTNLSNEGMGFTIEWERKLLVKENETRLYNVNENWEPSSYSEREKNAYGLIISWTQERENFLKDLDKQLGILIFKIAEFFQDDKKLLEFMDSGKKLLQ